MTALLRPPDLTERVPGPELMDGPHVGGPELARTLVELRVINRRLGGWAASIAGLSDLLERTGAGARPLRVVDVGGGSGDGALALLAWADRTGLDLTVTVLERHAETAALARAHTAHEARVAVLAGDLFDLPEDSFDVAHAALLLHHFDGDGAAHALAAMARCARVGVVLNDLRRHPVPWLLIRCLTAAFSRNRLIRHDAPLSVARAFDESDWRRLARETSLDLRWRRRWAWRWVVTGVRP